MQREVIRSKEDLKYYLSCDKIALRIPAERKFPRPFYDVIWKYEILLRKTEYYHNNKGLFNKLLFILYRTRLQTLSNKLSIFIPINVFGPGLSIAHAGAVVVNAAAQVGCNCRIHECVTIGATGGEKVAAKIGDNCFIGSGAKVIGAITLGNDVAIGAGAVVVKSFSDDGITLAGVPAKIISHNSSASNIVKATELYYNLKDNRINEQ